MRKSFFIARQHAVRARRDIVLPILSVCLSVRLSFQCRYYVETNGHTVTIFNDVIGASAYF